MRSLALTLLTMAVTEHELMRAGPSNVIKVALHDEPDIKPWVEKRRRQRDWEQRKPKKNRKRR